MLKSIRNYIIYNETQIKVLKNKVYISNYKEIRDFDETNILVIGDYNIKITGKKLVISKLINSELLIIGDINSIVLGDK